MEIYLKVRRSDMNGRDARTVLGPDDDVVSLNSSVVGPNTKGTE